MHVQRMTRAASGIGALTLLLVLAFPVASRAQGPSIEIYGFGMADAIIDFNQVNPDWYDSLRPSKMPSSENQFGQDGHSYLSARQTRFGTRAEIPTEHGPVKVQFEFDMYGVGPDAGLTTIRFRHGWGQWRQFGGGQTNTQFMDIDVFPNTLEYWGPPGMAFIRLPQVFWRPKDTPTLRATIAVEAPGASGDGGVEADRVQLQGITPRFPLPDLTGEVKVSRGWGYGRVSGVLGKLKYDDNVQDNLQLSGDVTRWGVGLSSNIKGRKGNDVIRLNYIFGQGIANYFNDNPIDVGVKLQPGNAVTPFVGEALMTRGFSAYLDHNWTPRWSTAVGMSGVTVDNSDGQTPDAYRRGTYFSANLLHAPVPNVLMGGELLWGHRENNSDGFSSDDVRIQLSFKFSFSGKFGG